MIVASHLAFLTVKWAYNRLAEKFMGKTSENILIQSLDFSKPVKYSKNLSLILIIIQALHHQTCSTNPLLPLPHQRLHRDW